jgi:hypothetical protein
MVAAAAALAPAWAAIRDGRHKAAAFAVGPAATAQPFLRCYSAAWVYATMATAGVSLLEKQRKYQEATEYLHQLLGGPLHAATATSYSVQVGRLCCPWHAQVHHAVTARTMAATLFKRYVDSGGVLCRWCVLRGAPRRVVDPAVH